MRSKRSKRVMRGERARKSKRRWRRRRSRESWRSMRSERSKMVSGSKWTWRTQKKTLESRQVLRNWGRMRENIRK